MDPALGIDAHRQAVTAAAQALTEMSALLHGVDNAELGALLEQVDELVSAGAGVRAEVVLETVRRGIPNEAGKNTREWIIEYCPSLRQAGAGQLAKIVKEVVDRTSITAGCDYDDPDSCVDSAAPVAMIWDKVRAGAAGAPLALATLSEMDRLKDRIKPEFIPVVTEGMLTMGIGFGQTAMRDLKMELIAKYGLKDEADKDQAPLSKHAFLSSPQPESGDLTRYSMALAPDQAARLEAALGPLSKPQPNPETGEPDLRPNGQRRVEALLELVARATSLDAAAKGGPAESDTALHLTIGLDDLRAEAGAGEAIASRADGTLLSTATIRALACYGDLIPTLLGERGEVMHHGATLRLFTRAQRRAIWLRDRGCTFPGCTAPAAWTQVHHIQHWADDGPTDLDNGALLCQRHHTHVHRKRLWAHVTDAPNEHGRSVHWDLTEGSYDHHLRIRRANSPARQPRPPGRTSSHDQSRPPGPSGPPKPSGSSGPARPNTSERQTRASGASGPSGFSGASGPSGSSGSTRPPGRSGPNGQPRSAGQSRDA